MQWTAVKPDAGRELLVLGVLRRQPLSAYSIYRALRDHSALYRPLGQGNVYHLVDRLEREGCLLRRTAKAQRGPRTSKNVFQLSALGENRFHQLLQRVVSDPQSSDSTLEIAIVLLGQIPRPRARQMLALRDDELAAQERRIKRLFGDMDSRSGPGSLAGNHALLRVQSERHFLRAALKKLVNPRWHPEWVLHDGPVVDPKRRL
ncbi:MAG TPA: helix-turn-helix transcriptional regulator [Candidatus Baltobacteraceae bacterium]|jgi:DNA-binding PadR family transcriptional regulator|nr:helix-turn-helix transcriptional regulator [Candidatus Baltobacteraceae bacterium]